jgi:lipoyl(octanoyl) transferase
MAFAIAAWRPPYFQHRSAQSGSPRTGTSRTVCGYFLTAMTSCHIVSYTGLVTYADTLAEQYRRLDACLATGEGDTLLLLEHPPTITIGHSSREGDLLRSEAELRADGIDVVETDRGGEITYHCPGQLVGYPILNLEHHRRDLHAYLRNLEEVIIRTLANFGISAGRVPGLTGVWTKGRKIAAIGIKARRWVTMHGFALNIDNDLTPFRRDFVPCGIRDRDVTSMQEVLTEGGNGGRSVTRADVEPVIIAEFCAVFGVSRVRANVHESS